MPEFTDDFFKYTAVTDSDRGGHPIECYTGVFSCSAKVIPLFKLASHFPELRNLKRLLYEVRRIYNHLIEIDSAITRRDFDFLQKLADKTQLTATSFPTNSISVNFGEDQLYEKFKKTVTIFKTLSRDLPKNPCYSCERLFAMRDVSAIEKTLPKIKDSSIWNELEKIVPESERLWLCHYCFRQLKLNKMPSTCILNDLFTDHIPMELRDLNEYEKLLMQRAKSNINHNRYEQAYTV